IYNKTQVANLLTGKQNVLIFRDTTQLNPIVQGFPLLGGGNIVPGISVVPPLSLTNYGKDYIDIGVDLSLKADKSTTYTKSEVETIASTRQATITPATSFGANNASFAGYISTRIWTSPTSWTDKCRFEATGNAYISGTINVIRDILSSIGNISTTSGHMSVGSISTTGTGNCDGYIRCKSQIE
ncbi:MAG: hypothetical protein ACKPKO_57095, partial [Candidatus Fonsibacter sp.]